MRFALLGTDPDGLAMASALVSSGRHQLGACTSPIPDAIEDAWGTDVRRVEDVEDALADPSLGMVIVAAPLSVRAALLRRAVQSERHVLCVWPPDRSPDVAYEAGMIQRETGSTLLPLLPHALHPGVQRLAELRRVGGPGPGRLVVVEAELVSEGEVLSGIEESGAKPSLPGWEVLRLIGGEIEEVSAFAGAEELLPGGAVLVSGRFVAGGLFQATLLPRQRTGQCRLTLVGEAGRAELYLPLGWKGPAYLQWTDGAGEEHEQSWEGWDGWAALVGAFEAAAGLHVEGSALPVKPAEGIQAQPRRPSAHPGEQALSWQDAVRGLELDDAARRSVARRRASTLEHLSPEMGEETSFKGTMTLVGCSLVWGMLLLLILSNWVPWAGWLIAPVLVVFLGLQLLRYLIPRGPGPDQDNEGPLGRG